MLASFILAVCFFPCFVFYLILPVDPFFVIDFESPLVPLTFFVKVNSRILCLYPFAFLADRPGTERILDNTAYSGYHLPGVGSKIDKTPQDQLFRRKSKSPLSEVQYSCLMKIVVDSFSPTAYIGSYQTKGLHNNDQSFSSNISSSILKCMIRQSCGFLFC